MSSTQWKLLPFETTGNTLGRRLEDAVFYARQQRQAHIEFSSTFSAEQITRWAQMLQDWNADPTGPDPYQEPEQGENKSGHLTNKSKGIDTIICCSCHDRASAT